MLYNVIDRKTNNGHNIYFEAPTDHKNIYLKVSGHKALLTQIPLYITVKITNVRHTI